MNNKTNICLFIVHNNSKKQDFDQRAKKFDKST